MRNRVLTFVKRHLGYEVHTTWQDWWIIQLAQYDGHAWHETTRRLHAFYFGKGHSGFTLKLGPYRIAGYQV